jgi:hypothetical protein
MPMVRMKEEQAEAIAHVVVRTVKTHKCRADPLIGLIPVMGDAIATLLGAAFPILLYYSLFRSRVAKVELP